MEAVTAEAYFDGYLDKRAGLGRLLASGGQWALRNKGKLGLGAGGAAVTGGGIYGGAKALEKAQHGMDALGEKVQKAEKKVGGALEGLAEGAAEALAQTYMPYGYTQVKPDMDALTLDDSMQYGALGAAGGAAVGAPTGAAAMYGLSQLYNKLGGDPSKKRDIILTLLGTVGGGLTGAAAGGGLGVGAGLGEGFLRDIDVRSQLGLPVKA